MLVRDLSGIKQKRGWIPAVATAAIAIGALQVAPIWAQQASAMPATHTVKRGDTLWDISKLYLGDPYLWPEIYRNNTDVIEDPHWIYPGEVLKLPGQARVVAVTPPPASTPEPQPQPTSPAPVASNALMPTQPPAEPQAQEPQAAVVPVVRGGEYAAAPWVDQTGGPRGAGYIIQAAALPGVATADQSRMNLYDKVFFAPPVGAVAPEHDLYLAYRLGPAYEGFGQIVIPTGLIETTRSPRNGEAATGRVVRLFSEMLQGQFLIPFDSAATIISGTPSPVTNGRSGTVRWVSDENVLPTVQDYVIVDIARRDGIQTGDWIELYEPRKRPADGKGLIIPEVSVARAQVLRVTPFGATAILTSQEQPKIGDGTSARIAAKMP